MFLGLWLVAVVRASTSQTENIAYCSCGTGAVTLDPHMGACGHTDFLGLPKAAVNVSMAHPGHSAGLCLGVLELTGRVASVP